MIRECDWCGEEFDTRDGGFECYFCSTVYCPKCEVEHKAGTSLYGTLCKACVEFEEFESEELERKEFERKELESEEE